MQALTEAVAIDGFWLLVAAAAVAGLVRGFSGFGTAMVYLPVAGQILTPFQALTTLMVMDLIGPLPNIPNAIRTGHKRDILRLSAGNVLGGWLFRPGQERLYRAIAYFIIAASALNGMPLFD